MTDNKQCPYCSEEILTTAKKCKHCGEFIDGELRRAKVESFQREKIIREQESSKTKNNKGLWWKIAVGLFLLGIIISIVAPKPTACECYDHLVKAEAYGAAYTNPNYSAVMRCHNYYHLTQAYKECFHAGGLVSNHSKDTDVKDKAGKLEDAYVKLKVENLCNSIRTNIYDIEATPLNTESITDCLFDEMLKNKNDISLVFSACDKLKYILFKISGGNGADGVTSVNALFYEDDYNDLVNAYRDFKSLQKALQEQKIAFRDFEDNGVKYKVISLASKEW